MINLLRRIDELRYMEANIVSLFRKYYDLVNCILVWRTIPSLKFHIQLMQMKMEEKQLVS
jgi:hypothetical protein